MDQMKLERLFKQRMKFTYKLSVYIWGVVGEDEQFPFISGTLLRVQKRAYVNVSYRSSCIATAAARVTSWSNMDMF